MPDPIHSDREIFNAALELTTATERAAYLDRVCEDDPEQRRRVEALLQAHDSAGGFFTDADGIASAAKPAEIEIREAPGARIGRYKLLERLGEGGFGIVYMAEQDEPVRRRVALKIIKLGMDTRAVVARFEAERQALARMEHPNIANVLDGGATESGRPFFVMELVRGVPITEFCDQQKLPTRERMELFAQVCHAVQHAHQKGIIHRDLKPSNILVTLHDDRPVPKVIDFGIAKAIDQPLTEKTMFTRFHHFVGTPAYMSPEQAGISGLDLDTRADIYSLGVLLYELLTGRTPFDTRALLESGYDEILRTIREREPSRPSQRLASLSLAELTTAAQRRRLDGRQLVSRLRGDLDWIVMKCLQKDRQRRYATANGLAMDLERHLGNEPVLARPDTLAYRATKFVRRHRTPVAFAALLLVVLVSGLVGTITQARRAEKQAALAEAQRRRADEQRDFALRQLSRVEAINDLNTFLLSDAAPVGTTFTAGTLLAHAEHVIERQYGDTDENRVAMLIAIGRQYDTHDDNAKAREILGRARALSLHVADRSIRAEAGAALAAAIARGGDVNPAEKLYQQTLLELGDDPRFALTRVFCLLRGGEIARETWLGPESIKRVQLAQSVLHESGLKSAVLELRVAMDLAESYRIAGRQHDANASFRQAFDQMKALGRDDTETAGTLLNNWALVLYNLGQPLISESLFRKAIDIGRANETDEHVSPMLLNNMARTLNFLGRHKEARAFAERAYGLARASGAEIVVNQALMVGAAVYLKLGDLDRAAAALAEVEPRFRRMMPANNNAFVSLAGQQAALAQARGDVTAAAAKIEEALALAEANHDSFNIPLFHEQRANFALQNGHPAEAEASAERAVRLRQEATEVDTQSAWLGSAYLIWARALRAEGKTAEANAAYASALKELTPTMDTDNPNTREAAEGLTAMASLVGGASAPQPTRSGPHN